MTADYGLMPNARILIIFVCVTSLHCSRSERAELQPTSEAADSASTPSSSSAPPSAAPSPTSNERAAGAGAPGDVAVGDVVLIGGRGYAMVVSVLKQTATHLVVRTTGDGHPVEQRVSRERLIAKRPPASDVADGDLVVCPDSIGSLRVARVVADDSGSIGCEFAHGGNRHAEPSELIPIDAEAARAIIRGAAWESRVDDRFFATPR